MRILIPFLGLAALAGLCWFCVHASVPAIEADLSARAAGALAEHELGGVKAEAEGLDVRLSGTAPSVEVRDHAYRIARRVEGVRRVLRSITVVPSGAYAATDSIGAAAPPGAGTTTPAVSGRTGTETASRPVAPSQDASSQSAARAVAPPQDPPNPSSSSGLASSPAGREPLGRPSAPAENPIKACQRDIDNLLKARRIQFVTASAGITESSLPLLDGLLVTMLRYPEAHLEIAGHTDSRGIEDLNLRLSQARAEAVRNYLVQRGVDPARLVAIGFGATHPIALNDTEEGRSMNRRIEFYVRGAQP